MVGTSLKVMSVKVVNLALSLRSVLIGKDTIFDILLYIMMSQSQDYWQFGLDRSLLWEADFLSIAGCSAASLDANNTMSQM